MMDDTEMADSDVLAAAGDVEADTVMSCGVVVDVDVSPKTEIDVVVATHALETERDAG